ncbi:murein hydrolase activator EnvC family protein [Limnobacter litoralis]|uniref:M23ase beta-sheet core domain-containing protein n=2 Tax=Limnobacter TaxID=131079 RepID=A0ABQ5YPJ5_9BURK|nr:peptidoglycan DD-metalloendopeptidase family protein [Limnobacter litoralis]GLR25260.1 hypothetical protein GCM10007875_03480 [Limnobacter litoralis]
MSFFARKSSAARAAVLYSLAVALLTHGLAGVAAIRDPAGVKQEREDVRKKLQDIKKAITQTSGEKQKVSNAIKQLDKQLANTESRLAQLSKDRKALEDDIADLKTKQAAVEAALADTEKRLASVIRNQYRRSDINPTQAWLAGQSASQAAREGYWYQRISSAEKQLGDTQAAQASQLQSIREGMEKKRERLEKTIKSQDQKQRELKSQKEERQQLVEDLSSKLKGQELEKKRLERDDKRLTGVIADLTRAIEQAKREQAARRKREQENPGSPPSGRKTPNREVESPPIPDTGDFAKLKGRLQLPVQGSVVGRFGETRSKDGQGPSWKGIFIKTEAGQPVRAVGSGKVVFAEWLRGFGELVIIDHGDQYLSVYGNNSKLLKSAGDLVKAGDTIAETGNSSGNLETGLYFELRHQGQPFDPISWTKGH